MISKKDITLANDLRKIGKKMTDMYKDNFSKFLDGDFYVRFIFEDEDGKFTKAIEYPVNSANWLDYINSAMEVSDFGDQKVVAVEISTDKNK